MRFFYILFLMPFQLFAQSYYKDLPFYTNKVTVNAPDHTIVAFINPVKGKVRPGNNKFYFWYSANHISSSQGGYRGKLLNGPYSDYYLNKNPKEQGEFRKGLKQGVWKEWFDNGNLKEVVKWRSGARNGRFFRYTTDGKLKESGRYRRGKIKGKLLSYPDSSTMQGKPKFHKPNKILSRLKKTLKLKKHKEADKKKKREKNSVAAPEQEQKIS